MEIKKYKLPVTKQMSCYHGDHSEIIAILNHYVVHLELTYCYIGQLYFNNKLVEKEITFVVTRRGRVGRRGNRRRWAKGTNFQL